ncbi:MAG: HAMP domain-containing histidine kinase [Nonlabens sp.]|nr:HAMP domain-containing histidine kinase [Nonlabens sp.]MDP5100307.1 HAMP domain-containing histidine kinase [Nonlabens sp.]
MLPNPKDEPQQLLQDKIYFLEETAAMTATGAYSGNAITKEGFIDDIGRAVLNIPNDFIPTLKSSARFFVDKEAAKERLNLCLSGGSFECDILMCDFYGVQFWAKAVGKPWFNENNQPIGIKGVFTSIDRFVKKSKEVELHARIIEAQKDRLIDFADIVSHNLRSHASNLQLTLETFEETVDLSDIKVFKDYLKNISGKINQTLRHLNTVVTAHTVEKQFEELCISVELEEILDIYRKELQEKNVTINVDFAAFDTLCYVKTYLLSILKNLISNAVRYKHPDRDCVIEIRTKILHDKKLLIIKDNGSGIDLEKNGDKVFKMYKTFHGNEDARGLGLFVVKNQVESVNGDVSIKSQLNQGTSLTIRF